MRFVKADHEKMRELIQKGYAVKEIAQICEVVPQTVMAERLRMHREIGEGLDEGKIWALAWGGWTIDRIAWECHCTPRTVLKVLERKMKGFPRRGKR